MFESSYVALVHKALAAPQRATRNATTRSFFGHHLIVDDLVTGHMPLLLGRKLFTKGVIGEFAAFLNCPKSVGDFKAQGCNYWDSWGDPDGSIRVDYGNAWRDFNGVDQLQQVVNSLRNDPTGRRHLITGWRPDHLDTLSLPCCHYAYQWYVTNTGVLEMKWDQRSVDIMVGLPSDIILAAVWTILIANELGLKPGKLHFMLGDCHIYDSHIASGAVAQYLTQLVYHTSAKAPTWDVANKATVFNFEPKMFQIHNYLPAPAVQLNLEV